MSEWILGALLAGLVVQTLTLYKVRKIHLASYRLEHALRQTESEARTLYQQFQAYDGLMRLIHPVAPLPPLRHWAASPDFLLELALHVRHRRPEAILECSSGSSTLVLARSCELNGAGHVFSLEHDEHYAIKTRQLLEEQELTEWATIIHAPLVSVSGHDQPWYEPKCIPTDRHAFDMVVIDGPPADTSPLARYPALPMLNSYISVGASVFLDDANRKGEQAVLRRWQSEFPEYKQTQLHLEKGGARLEKAATQAS
jgi:predicted O-methyltransferase YrrM